MNVYATPEYRALECRYDGPIPREEIEIIRAKYRQPSELERAEAMARQAFDDTVTAKARSIAAMTTAGIENALDDLACAEIELRHWTARVALLQSENAASMQSMAPVFNALRRAGE